MMVMDYSNTLFTYNADDLNSVNLMITEINKFHESNELHTRSYYTVGADGRIVHEYSVSFTDKDTRTILLPTITVLEYTSNSNKIDLIDLSNFKHVINL